MGDDEKEQTEEGTTDEMPKQDQEKQAKEEWTTDQTDQTGEQKTGDLMVGFLGNSSSSTASAGFEGHTPRPSADLSDLLQDDATFESIGVDI